MSKSKLCCQVSRDRLPVPPGYIANTTFFTLTVIKSCDLYHTDIWVLEHLNALAQSNLHKSQKNTKWKRKRQQTGKYQHLNVSWKHFSNANEGCAHSSSHRLHRPLTYKMRVSQKILSLSLQQTAWPPNPVLILPEQSCIHLPNTSGFWVSNYWHDTACQVGQAKERMLHKGSASYDNSSFNPESTAIFYTGFIKLLTG